MSQNKIEFDLNALEGRYIPKSRKVCQLQTCTKLLGYCMHCTCDGKCGRHSPGECGDRREGNGPSCKIPNCPKDSTCLHSTRASCVRCRNLARPIDRISQNTQHRRQKKLKSPKAMKNTTAQPAYTNKEVSSPTSLSSFPSTKQEVPVQLLTENIRNSLCDYSQWSSRRSTCNLIVIFKSTSFHLHKFPMLWECPKLKNELTIQQQEHSIVPTIHFYYFPGGVEAFEDLCIYAYTGNLQLCLQNFPSLYIGMQYMRMNDAANNYALQFIETLLHPSTTVHMSQVLQILHEICKLNDRWHVLSVTDPVVSCLIKTLGMNLSVSNESMQHILALPVEIFAQVVLKMLTDRLFTGEKNYTNKYLTKAYDQFVKIHNKGQTQTSPYECADICLQVMLDVLSQEINSEVDIKVE